MKPFNLEEAKAGKPVVTRTGKPVRFLCFDAKGLEPIVALIELDTTSHAIQYNESGIFWDGKESDQDLFMKSEIKEGWVIALKNSKLSSSIYNTKEEAEFCSQRYPSFVAVAKIEWEE